MRKRFVEADRAALKAEMRALLIGLARRRQTITYSELAAALTTACVHHRAPEFHRLIVEMSREDEAAGHVALAPLIVRKDSGIPGMGFFVQTAVEGGEAADLEAFWRAAFERACDYWDQIGTA